MDEGMSEKQKLYPSLYILYELERSIVDINNINFLNKTSLTTKNIEHTHIINHLYSNFIKYIMNKNNNIE